MIIHQSYPKEKVFVDNRPEAYPSSFFQNIYFPMQDSQEVFTRESKKYNFNTIIISLMDTSQDTSFFLSQIVKNEEWKMVYLNNSVVILLKNTQNNQAIIASHTITENTIALRKSDLNDKEKVRRLVNFFMFGGNSNWLLDESSLFRL